MTSPRKPPVPPAPPNPRSTFFRAALLMLGLCALLVAAAAIFEHPRFRFQIDATKTRAYTLSDSTQSLLNSLKGDWTISVIMVEQDSDPAVVRQVDEVLKRFAGASSSISVSRIDPTNPASIGEYERLLSHLQSSYAGLINDYNRAVDRGTKAFNDLRAFADRQTTLMTGIIDKLAKDDQQKLQLEQLRTNFLQLIEQGDALLAAITRLRQTTASQPIPDYDAARSTLAANHAMWSGQLDNVARLFGRWRNASSASDAVKQYASATISEYETTAQSLKNSQDELTRLAPLELTDVGRQLAEGECAIVMGPERAGVIASWQIFPRIKEEKTRFDRRFRGEEVIAATIRSLLIPKMPMVVFVHAEDESMLRRREQNMDYFAMADALRAARYDVREWLVGKGERPATASEQQAVWIIAPLLQRSGLELSKNEQKLIAATRELLAEGQPVLLTVARSLLPIFRQSDPWSTIAAPYGIAIDTGKVIFESVRVQQGTSETIVQQVVRTASEDSPIGRAVNGQALYFNHPTPLSLSPESEAISIAAIAPSSQRWIENDWRGEGRQIQKVPEDKLFNAVQSIVATVELPNVVTQRKQRLVAVGSSWWFISRIADQSVDLGGSRLALAFPGNRELLLSSVAWLAGLDDLIAAGNASRGETQRLDGITDNARLFAATLSLVILPGACLALGALIWALRRRS